MKIYIAWLYVKALSIHVMELVLQLACYSVEHKIQFTRIT